VPQVKVDGLAINYDVQGEGEPLLLIPYTSADHACYAFQLPAYTEHFLCIALDLPGTGESDKPAGPYSTEGYADQVAVFLGAIGVEQAHVAGVSLGAAVGMHLAARHPGRVRSLSLHSGWDASDDYLKIVVEQWRALASTLPTVSDVVIQGIFPWCFTPEMYVDRPEFVDTLVDFVRGRPAQPLDAFLAQIDAVIAHDASAALGDIGAPTLITFGARDLVCSRRFAEPLKSRIGEASWSSSSTCRTPGCTRTPRPSTARRSTSCCASAHDATHVRGRPRCESVARATAGVGESHVPA
jgi:pimeloyl-ACP methyl ester carboxylesterase